MEQHSTLQALIVVPTHHLSMSLQTTQQQSLKNPSFKSHLSSLSGMVIKSNGLPKRSCLVYTCSGNRLQCPTTRKVNETLATAPSRLEVKPKVGQREWYMHHTYSTVMIRLAPLYRLLQECQEKHCHLRSQQLTRLAICSQLSGVLLRVTRIKSKERCCQ